LKQELNGAGINTDHLESSNKKLAKSYEAVKKSQEELARISAAQQETRQSITKVKGQLTGVLGTVAAIGAVLLTGPVKSAMEFESSMADVVKVVSGLKDATTGELTEEYRNMKKELIDLSTVVPTVAKDLAKIAASAGQAGLAREEIVQFTEDAAKMGIAFDSTAEQSGEWMAKWRTAFGMTQTEVTTLADKINTLSDTTASSAQEIASIVTKVGPLGEVAGLASGEIAALGAALVSVGVKDDVAATGIKKMIVEMTAGTSATKKQGDVLDKMGLSATDLANRMQKDAQGAILDFLGAVNKLPKAEQAAALSDYFGTEAVGSIAPMLTKLDLLKTSFNKVGDSLGYAGSMEREFESRSATTENKIILAKNSLNKLSMAIGENFLPYAGQAAEKVSELVTEFSDFAAKNPELLKTIVKVVAGLVTLRAGSLAAKLGFLELKSGVLGVQKIIKLFTGNVEVSGAGMVTNLGKMGKSVTLLKATFTALTGPVGIAVLAVAAITAGVFLFAKSQEKARQQTLNFSNDLKTVADGFEKVTDNVNQTKALISEYRNLETKVKDVATSADEAATAKQRMKEIEDLLIQQNPDVISKYDQENGKISENLGLIEKKIGKELELAKIQYEQKQYEAEQNLPDALSEIANLNEKTKSLREQYDASKKVRDGLLEITQEWEVFYASNPKQDELYNKLDQLKLKAAELGEVVGESWNFDGSGMAGITTTYAEYANEVTNIVGSVTKSQEELNTATQSVKDYYDASVGLVELDLGGNFETAAGNLVLMNTELSNLEKNGQEGSQRALELKEQIAKIEPQLETAAVKIRDLGLAIEDVPEVKAINVLEATQNIDGFIEKINQIPTSKKVQLIIDQRGSSVPGYAKGTSRTPSTFIAGEKGPELITNAKNRSVFTAAQTGNILKNINNYNSQKTSGNVGINIPGYAKGTSRTPSTFIAGEKGPELITNAKNRSVFTAEKTKEILTNIKSQKNSYSNQKASRFSEITPKIQQIISGIQIMAKTAISNIALPKLQQVYDVAAGATTLRAPALLTAAGTGGTTIQVYNQPTIQIDGEKPDDLDNKLKRNNEDLLNKIDERIRKKEDDERRSKYE